MATLNASRSTDGATVDQPQRTILLDDAARGALRRHVELETAALGEAIAAAGPLSALGRPGSLTYFERLVEHARLHARVWRAVEEGALALDEPTLDLVRHEREQVAAAIGDEELALDRQRAGDLDYCLVGMTLAESERVTSGALAGMRGDVAALDSLIARAARCPA